MTLIVWVERMPTQNYAPEKGRDIKGLIVCNGWDLEPFDLTNGLYLGCYQLCSEVSSVAESSTLIQLHQNSILAIRL